MLYNPEWEVQAKPDVFSLESLIAWLEKQPADRAYCYIDGYGCLAAQYLQACGIVRCYLTPDELRKHGWYYIASGYPDFDFDGDPEPRTFGAALERARKAAA